MLRVLTKSDYLLRETLLGLQRGGWMNWAAISTVTVLLFLFGVSVQSSWQLEGLLNQFGSQLEVSVYLDTGVDAATLQPLVTSMPGVMNVTPLSKEIAWANLTQEMGIPDVAAATKQLNGNPLVDELKVKARAPQDVPILAQQLRQLQGVNEVQYVDEAVQRIAQLNRGISWVSLTVTALLTLTAIAVITTTIRLIVLARRKEIEIMQLVGATAAWIYLPFVFQGVTFGVVGATIAWLLINTTNQFLSGIVARQPEFVKFLANGLQLSSSEVILLPLMLLSFGASVGVMGSLFAVRRFATR